MLELCGGGGGGEAEEIVLLHMFSTKNLNK